MIERYVFIKLAKEYATPDGRAEIAAYSQQVLAGLPGVAGLKVGTPADEAAAGAWDISIAVSFARAEDIEPYRVHPLHRAYVDEYLRPRMVVIKAWNFEVAG